MELLRGFVCSCCLGSLCGVSVCGESWRLFGFVIQISVVLYELRRWLWYGSERVDHSGNGEKAGRCDGYVVATDKIGKTGSHLLE